MTLPPLFDRWTAELLGQPVQGEPLSTCEDCAMWPGEDGKRDEQIYFTSGKCCTFLPRLPNFLVGQALACEIDEPETRHGRAVLRRAIEKRETNPLGMPRKLTYALRYRHSPGSFGRNEGLLCPLYVAETGRCGIWRSRNSTCSTWFCKHDRGVLAFHYWRRVQVLLEAIEIELRWWCAHELGLAGDDLGDLHEQRDYPLWRKSGRFTTHLTGSLLESGNSDGGRLGRRSRQSYRGLWGEWAGREEAYFIECANLVEALSWQDVQRIAGDALDEDITALREYLEVLETAEIPDHLVSGEIRVSPINDQHSLVHSYGPFDPRKIPNVVVGALAHFDGRSTRDARAAAAAEGVDMSDDLVRRLFDLRVLMPRHKKVD